MHLCLKDIQPFRMVIYNIGESTYYALHAKKVVVNFLFQVNCILIAFQLPWEQVENHEGELLTDKLTFDSSDLDVFAFTT